MKKLLLCLLMLTTLPAWAAERILQFHSDIQVHANGAMTVTETIRVRAEGQHIKRGIYRDFPTTYKTASGRRHKVDFRVIGVERDGKPEAWHSQRLSNGMRVYFGRSEVLLKPGEYQYRFTYHSHRQIGFFDQHDELYWNVTGNGWDFPIDRASAWVQLPQTVSRSDLRGEAYTGPQGAQGEDWRWQVTPSGGRFETTAPLAEREGLTIALGWPKGLINEPTRQDRLRWLWQDNPALIIIWLGSLAVLIYYLLAWLLVGRDPAAGVILPEYAPPAGYSPAAMRLIRRMTYDNKALSAALVSMAVQDAVILRERDDQYSVHRADAAQQPAHDDEQAALKAIGSSLNFKKSSHEKVRKLIDSHRDSLVSHYKRRYYYANRGWLIPGVFLSVVVLAGAAWGVISSYGPEAIFILFMSAFSTAFAAPFLTQLWRMRQAYERNFTGWARLIGSALPLLILVAVFWGSELIAFLNFVPWPVISGVMVLVLLNLLFNHLIKAPTRKGRALLDRVEGFRQYLSLAEGDELKLRYAKPVTPELFEAYLPYAIALDVETAWSERFAAELRAAGEEPSSYRTRWYDGNDFRGVRGVATSVAGSLAASVSSASTPPGSSSGGSFGGGGGGSSGGGGGGGGGGGW